MYKCDACNEVVPPGTKQNLIPAETREKNYRFRSNAHKVRRAGKKRPHLKDDPGGTGHELVSELKACPSCWAKYLDLASADPSAEQQAA